MKKEQKLEPKHNSDSTDDNSHFQPTCPKPIVSRRCSQHRDCKKVKGDGSFFEIVKCPWCGYEVSTSNIGKWCASCYCLFKVEKGWVHFSKKFEKTMAQALAIALAKCGGMKLGDVTKSGNGG